MEWMISKSIKHNDYSALTLSSSSSYCVVIRNVLPVMLSWDDIRWCAGEMRWVKRILSLVAVFYVCCIYLFMLLMLLVFPYVNIWLNCEKIIILISFRFRISISVSYNDLKKVRCSPAYLLVTHKIAATAAAG